MARAAATPQWRADQAVVRDLGLAATGFGGALSSVLTQVLGLVPLGPLSFRASLGAALALSLGAYLLLRVTRQLLALTVTPRTLVSPSVRSLVAAISAAAVALSPTWQQEGTVAGGASVAVTLMLLGVTLLVALGSPGHGVLTVAGRRGWILLGLVAGVTTAENVAAGMALLCVIGTALCAARRRVPPRLKAATLLAFTLALLVLGAPPVIRAAAPYGWAAVANVVAATDWSALAMQGSRVDALAVFAREIGYVTLALAVAGAGIGLWRRPSRALVAALVLLVPLHLVYPLAAAGALAAEPLVAVRMAALGALGICSAVGVTELLGFLLGLQLPLARPAAVLTVVFHATVVAVAVEEGAFVSDRSEHVAAEVWTDEALGALPARAALLVRSPTIAWRLWAARLLRGERPDVLIVPQGLVGEIPAVVHLLGTEPSSEPLLRDLAMGATPSEFALSAVADARPLYVELDPAWDRQVTSHLSVEGLWLRYAPQPLGPPDRERPRQPMLEPSAALAVAIAQGRVRDDATARVVSRTLKEQAATLSMLGLPADATVAVDRLEFFAAADPFVTGARLRLAYAQTERGRSVELRDLLRF
jgi:hypothetical protein